MSKRNVLPLAWINSAGIWSMPADVHLLSILLAHILRRSRIRY